jgi:hypothetical protein
LTTSKARSTGKNKTSVAVSNRRQGGNIRQSSKTAIASAKYEVRHSNIDAIYVFHFILIQRPIWTNHDEDVKPLITRTAASPVSYTRDSNQPGDSIDVESDSSVEIIEPSEPRNEGWPTDTHLVYPASGGKIALGPQNTRVRHTARCAIQSLYISICFEDAFPDVCLRTKFNRDALYKSAKDQGFVNIAKRLQSDVDFANIMSGLVCIPFD